LDFDDRLRKCWQKRYDASMTVTKQAIAYFSAEYAIADDLPIYAGGLGILAADLILQAGSQNLPFYGVGLVYHEAFTGDDPDQRVMTERLTANGFEPAIDEKGERILVQVLVESRTVALQAWVKGWGHTKLILLDARLDENDERDRAVSDHLYAKDITLELAQEICLGFGGLAMLEAMGLKPDVYHLNEGHTALAGLALVLRYLKSHPEISFEDAVAIIKPQLVGTKHTILGGAGILLDWGNVSTKLEPTLIAHSASLEDLKSLATKKNGDYSDTKLLISLTRIVSGVSRVHVAQESHQHPESKLIAITNGIFRWRWTTASWAGQPLKYDDAKFWAIHCENRHRLLEHVRQQTGDDLNPDSLTVVWARRMAEYKRPELLVSDLAQLSKLVHNARQPVQFIVAGKPNPSDMVGIELMNRVIEAARHPELSASFAYLPHYNPVDAKFLVRGADLWLNTPVRGYEACGTSGMKASLNGSLQFSSSDGWIDEVAIKPIGWELPVENPADVLYDMLEHEIGPLFYSRTYGIPHDWIVKMRANMKLIVEHFTAERMLDDYYTKLYNQPSN
jgi:starch phosphorylase